MEDFLILLRNRKLMAPYNVDSSEAVAQRRYYFAHSGPGFDSWQGRNFQCIPSPRIRKDGDAKS